MFAVKSTPEEWRKGGMRFYKKRLWVAAIHYGYFKMAIFVRHPRQNLPILRDVFHYKDQPPRLLFSWALFTL